MEEATFTKWSAWRDRLELPGIKYPGVYALAVHKHSLADRDFSYVPEIVYFGMTNAVAGLRGRLKQFHNTLNGRLEHGGADRFRYDYSETEALMRCLYIAVLSFKCDARACGPQDLRTMGRVAMAEYECLAQYLGLFGTLPRYNDRKNSPKWSKRSRQ